MMAKSIILKELFALNPHIDEKELNKARKTLKKLRSIRIEGRARPLIPIARNRRISIGESDTVDSRTIRLGRFRR